MQFLETLKKLSMPQSKQMTAQIAVTSGSTEVVVRALTGGAGFFTRDQNVQKPVFLSHHNNDKNSVVAE